MIEDKLLNSPEQLAQWLLKAARPLVFTNGCFDILHRGHVSYLEDARSLGAGLLVAVNTDESVRRLNKGSDRPINPLQDRMALLASLESVSAVVAFQDETPLALIKLVQPDHLVKGGDWAIAHMVGSKEVMARGGQAHSLAFAHDRSTTQLLQRIRQTAAN